MSVKVYSKVNSGAVSAGGVSGLALLAVWAADMYGIPMTPEIAVAFTGVLGTAASWLGGYLKKETRQPYRPT